MDTCKNEKTIEKKFIESEELPRWKKDLRLLEGT